VAERERRSRTLFAQRSIKVEEVAKEWQAVRQAIGTAIDVQRFLTEVVQVHGGQVSQRDGTLEVHLPNRAALREACAGLESFSARFQLPVSAGELHLTRTHPIVEGLAAHVMDAALDPLSESVARRCGAIRTGAVQVRTTLLLVRMRYHILVSTGREERAMLAEECHLLGFTGAPHGAQWLPPQEAEELLDAQPAANITAQQATEFVRRVVEGFADLSEPLNQAAAQRGQELLEAHRRVRAAAHMRGVRYDVRPHLPPDVLGIYVLLPVLSA